MRKLCCGGSTSTTAFANCRRRGQMKTSAMIFNEAISPTHAAKINVALWAIWKNGFSALVVFASCPAYTLIVNHQVFFTQFFVIKFGETYWSNFPRFFCIRFFVVISNSFDRNSICFIDFNWIFSSYNNKDSNNLSN